MAKNVTEQETAAAIALALHLYLGTEVHDTESGIITIKPHASDWSCKALTMRRKP